MSFCSFVGRVVSVSRVGVILSLTIDWRASHILLGMNDLRIQKSLNSHAATKRIFAKNRELIPKSTIPGKIFSQKAITKCDHKKRSQKTITKCDHKKRSQNHKMKITKFCDRSQNNFVTLASIATGSQEDRDKSATATTITNTPGPPSLQGATAPSTNQPTSQPANASPNQHLIASAWRPPSNNSPATKHENIQPWRLGFFTTRHVVSTRSPSLPSLISSSPPFSNASVDRHLLWYESSLRTCSVGLPVNITGGACGPWHPQLKIPETASMKETPLMEFINVVPATNIVFLETLGPVEYTSNTLIQMKRMDKS